ncbi:Stp1/IreP family PP2C-type Ser/Thr phosphatase [Lactobacillus sp. DCY120]|uniref:Stp1/IreP family PP2C-type Ser/Thr phosphatase n=1 Tax=Bombilactobacillus apium TaxID=2675299 RepID=A0A850R8W1_9LACO|nr:Stp1/IreP family PP2C-type Ser/Thr phosphatase [Bombilactobacillus apium]NVY96965.1 Stp1/IreP family PP2C-type Ser/Thr phosphatase [Bombilactobacillus apium]
MQVAFQTDIGRQRQNNQDYVQAYSNQAGATLAVVADGMGGHRGGDVASKMVVEHLGSAFEQTQMADIETITHWAKELLLVENRRVIKASQEQLDLKGMGTTLVAAVVVEPDLLVLNVGDSRCYLFREQQLQQLSFDHSLVNELLVAGAITPLEAKNYPNKNIITQSLGVSSGLEPTAKRLTLESQDQVLLCSDGLTNMVSETKIAEILAQPLTTQAKCDLLVKCANQAGGLDNITVLILDLQAHCEVKPDD